VARVRIVTWNVNSIGARLPGCCRGSRSTRRTSSALQETKCADDAFPYADLAALGYEAAHAGDGRWNGVAVLSRVGLSDVSLALDGHPEPRLASAQCGPLHVTSAYVPNGRALGDPALRLQARVVPVLRERLDGFDPAQPLVVMATSTSRCTTATCGTSSTSRARPRTPAERAAGAGLLDWGLVDVEARPARATCRSPTGTTAPG
jgi:exodeoxyribonuclease-3